MVSELSIGVSGCNAFEGERGGDGLKVALFYSVRYDYFKGVGFCGGDLSPLESKLEAFSICSDLVHTERVFLVVSYFLDCHNVFSSLLIFQDAYYKVAVGLADFDLVNGGIL